MRRALATLCLLSLCPCTPASAETFTHDQILTNLVESHGIDRWDKVETLRFTFHVQRPKSELKRVWTWSPKTNVVKLMYDPKPDETKVVEYDRDELDGDTPREIRKIDRWFINDSFWLLLPLHLQWSQDVKLTDGPMRLAPMGRVIAREITVTYPEQGGGYTPGDVYKLYVDDQWRIHQWAFHRAGADKPSLTCIWVQDIQAGPLTLCSYYGNPDTKFKLYMTNVSVKLTGEDGWHDAKKVKHPCRNCP